MSEVIVYSSDYCPYCSRAKHLLASKGVAFEEIKVDGKPQLAMVRLGASDGSATEISGRDIAEGDVVIAGERSATETN